jgi:ribosome biogenesis GTPase
VVRGDWERYDYYQQMLDETLARQTYLEQRPDDEAAMKVKVGQLGQLQEEPKLEAKKYRRISRRSRQQSLQDLRVTLDGSVDDLQALDDIDVDAF